MICQEKWESFEIALTTKKIKTSESRIEFAKERLLDLDDPVIQNTFIEGEKELIHKKFNDLLNEYNTKKYIIQINTSIEKIKSLKTQKSKDKYFNMSQDLILESQSDNCVNQNIIKKLEEDLNLTYKENKID